MAKFRAWIKTRGALSVFAMSAIFNPLFYPFTAIAGMMHFGWWRFFHPLPGRQIAEKYTGGGGGILWFQVHYRSIWGAYTAVTKMPAAAELVHSPAAGHISRLVRAGQVLHRALQGRLAEAAHPRRAGRLVAAGYHPDCFRVPQGPLVPSAGALLEPLNTYSSFLAASMMRPVLGSAASSRFRE